MIFNLLYKDLILFFTEKRNYYFLIAMPIILCTILGAVFKDMGQGSQSIQDNNGVVIATSTEEEQTMEWLTFEVETVTGHKQLNGMAYYTIAMLAMFILFGSPVVATTLLRDQESKMIDRVKVIGVSIRQILGSKYLFSIVITCFQSMVMLLYSTFFLQVTWKPLGWIILVIFISANMIAAFSILIGAWTLKTKSYKLTNTINSVGNQVLALFGGSYIPLSQLPEVFTVVSKYIPNGLVLNALTGLMSGMAIGEIMPSIYRMLVLTFTALCCTAIVIKKSKKGDQVWSV